MAALIGSAKGGAIQKYLGVNCCTLPIPVSLNHMYTTNPHTGQRVLRKDGKAWLADAKRKLLNVCPEPAGKLDAISVFIFFPDLRVRDTSNYSKLILDALKGTVVKDDRWTMVGDEHYYPRLDRENPRVVVYWE